MNVLKPFPFLLDLVNKALASQDVLVVDEIFNHIVDLGGWGDEDEWSWDFEKAHDLASEMVEEHWNDLEDNQ